MTILAYTGFMVVAILANYRIRKLITYDTITEKFRDRFRHVEEDNGEYYYVPDDTFFAKLIFCHRCVGLWVAIVQVLLFAFVEQWSVLLIFSVFAVAAVTDMIYDRLVEGE